MFYQQTNFLNKNFKKCIIWVLDHKAIFGNDKTKYRGKNRKAP